MDESTDVTSGRAQRLRVWPMILPLGLAFGMFSSTGRDDSHITDWVAYALLRYGELVNYNGERVEQSSSLLHALLLAAAGKLTGLSIPTLGVLSSIAFGCATIGLTQLLARRVDATLIAPVAWLVGTSTCLLYWSFAGLETTLAASAVLVVVLCYARALDDDVGSKQRIGVFAATLAYLAVRPEAICVLGAVLLGLIAILALRGWTAAEGSVLRQDAVRMLWRSTEIVLLSGAGSVALLAWRHAYFGAWFPQPVTAKAGGVSLATLQAGMGYFLHHGVVGIDGALWALAPLAVLCVLGRTLHGSTFESVVVVAALFFVAGLSFVVASGGDWMECGRFLVPLVPLAAFCSVAELRRHVGSRLVMVGVALTVLGHAVATWTFATQSAPGGPPTARAHVDARLVPPDASWFEVMQRHHYRDLICSEQLIAIVRRIHQRTGKVVTVMSGQMGMIASRTAAAEFGRVRLIDRLGLTSRDFTDCPVTAALARRTVGLALVYERFFADRDQLRRECNLGDPDVIYDLGTPDGSREQLFERNGYRIVYRQDGRIVNGSRWIPGAAVSGSEIVALRSDLLGPDDEPVQFRFGP